MLIVAVYGTLKRGFYNHYLLKISEFLGTGISQNRFILGNYSYPAVVKGDEGAPVEVEIYEVDEKTMRNLDYLEGYPTFYTRSKEKFKLNGREVEAFIYHLPKEREFFIWKRPNSDIPHRWTEKGWFPVKQTFREEE